MANDRGGVDEARSIMRKLGMGQRRGLRLKLKTTGGENIEECERTLADPVATEYSSSQGGGGGGGWGGVGGG